VPFFQTAWSVNPLEPSQLTVSINGTQDGPTGIYAFTVPDNIFDASHAPDHAAFARTLQAMRRSKCLSVARRHLAGRAQQLRSDVEEAASRIADAFAAKKAAAAESLGALLSDAVMRGHRRRGAGRGQGRAALQRGEKERERESDVCAHVELSYRELAAASRHLAPGAWAAPELLYALESPAYVFQIGAYTNGSPDPTAFVAMNDTTLFVASAASGGTVSMSALPVAFAAPLNWSVAGSLIAFAFFSLYSLYSIFWVLFLQPTKLPYNNIFPPPQQYVQGALRP
jgi:hypothetical protein